MRGKIIKKTNKLSMTANKSKNKTLKPVDLLEVKKGDYIEIFNPYGVYRDITEGALYRCVYVGDRKRELHLKPLKYFKIRNDINKLKEYSSMNDYNFKCFRIL